MISIRHHERLGEIRDYILRMIYISHHVRPFARFRIALLTHCSMCPKLDRTAELSVVYDICKMGLQFLMPFRP